MIKFDDKYFVDFSFTKEQIKKNLDNAQKDLGIAKKDQILEVKFSYAYQAFIKAGIALLSFYRVKIKSVPGHHAKIIEKVAQILQDNFVDTIGNVMRSKRNFDIYSGGIEITEKECREYIEFVENALKKISKIIT